MSSAHHRRKGGRIRSISAIALLGAACTSAPALPAFPGAEGFGANAVGGRGGDVYHVTNLADTNTLGTLRYGLTHAPVGGRTIVFDVGGSIVMTSNLEVKNVSNVTIAGQTAPGPGITLINNPPAQNPNSNFYKFDVSSSSGQTTRDIIVRYLTVRRGVNSTSATTDDAVGVLGNGTTRNIILDHLSASWATDENLSVTNNAANVTISNSYISEALNPLGHAYGSLVRPQINSSVSFDHDFYADNRSRNPRPGNYNGTTLQFDFRNNVVYNWGDRAGYTGGASESDIEHVQANWVGNYFIAGPSTPTGSKSTTAYTLDTSHDTLDVEMYQSDNRIDSNHNAVRDGTDTGWGMFIESTGTTTLPFPDSSKVAAPWAFAGLDYLNTDTPEDAYAKILASGGGSLPGTRNAVDARIVAGVRNNSGAIINAPDLTEWNDLYTAPMTSRPAGFDTDRDGMPDAWEIARGLNPSAADNIGIGPNGYTNLENYLNDLTLIANWNTDADGNWSGILNWLGARPDAVDATANFGPVITAPRTITLDAPRTVGQINFDSANGYTIAGGAPLTLGVISGTASITVISGHHAIAAPLNLAAPTTVDVASGGSLDVSALQPTPHGLTKNGAGTLVANRASVGALSVSTGTMRLAPGGGVSRITQTLTVAPGATLDITNNALVIGSALVGTWSGSNYTGITGLIAAARNGGQWNGPGITTTSTAPGSNLTTLGIAGAGEVFGIAPAATANWHGQTVLGSDTLVMYTYGGDANLDGKLNIDDYGRIDGNVGLSGTVFGWFNGDFNYDGEINIDDYGIIDGNIGLQGGQGAPIPTAAQTLVGFADTGVTAVPEPAFVGFIMLTVATLPMRRRRQSGLRN